MDEQLTIYVDRLRGGEEEQIAVEVDPAFMEVEEASLSYRTPVKIEGVVYHAERELYLHLKVRAVAELPCRICNELVQIEVVAEEDHAVPLEDIRDGLYHLEELVREMVISETPHLVECDGDCPRRKEISRYLKKSEDKKSEGSATQPFSSLVWEEETED